ncbi:hypothetical protein B0H19DRAFT_1235746 [Mycena capillaripes]|nr:hypothetical protein B0H19DRAFT_1235746 [Mycena capillaripes]
MPGWETNVTHYRMVVSCATSTTLVVHHFFASASGRRCQARAKKVCSIFRLSVEFQLRFVGLVYDPDQDAEVKRAIRRNYRALHKTIDVRQADYSPAELETKVARANELFEDVKNTGEATLDSSFLKTVNINIQRVRGLKFGTGAFNVEDFVTKQVAFMGEYRPPNDADGVNEDEFSCGGNGRSGLSREKRSTASSNTT